MPGQPATSGAPSSSCVLLVDGGRACDVFELVAIEDDLVRVRSAFLFELGEELRIRIDTGAEMRDATARVRAHVGPDDDRLTELELTS